MMNFTEVSKAISEVSKKSMDMPKFGEGVSPKSIKDFNEADKKLSIDKEISNNISEEKNLTNKDIKEYKEEIKNLSENEQNYIREETGWSDEIINHIESWEQYEVYKGADLHEVNVNGRLCLVKDIDLNYVDEKTGLTNQERMERGLSPIDSKTGEKIELHHMGQSFDSPFAELNANSEHGGKNHSILHDNSVESWRRDPELKNQYQNHDKPDHWKNRLNEGGE